jgi:hypothetical protein
MNRNFLTRESFIPKGATAFRDKESSAVVYAYTDKQGRPCARAFSGKRTKPDWRYRFASPERREEAARKHFETVRARENARKERAATRKAFVHPFKPGDIFKTHWGYDQTNIEWYQCLEVKGKYLIVTEIATESYQTGDMEGRCVPLTGSPIGAPLRVLAREGGFRIESFIFASYQAPVMISGVATYPAARWSSYA